MEARWRLGGQMDRPRCRGGLAEVSRKAAGGDFEIGAVQMTSFLKCDAKVVLFRDMGKSCPKKRGICPKSRGKPMVPADQEAMRKA